MERCRASQRRACHIYHSPAGSAARCGRRERAGLRWPSATWRQLEDWCGAAGVAADLPGPSRHAFVLAKDRMVSAQGSLPLCMYRRNPPIPHKPLPRCLPALSLRHPDQAQRRAAAQPGPPSAVASLRDHEELAMELRHHHVVPRHVRRSRARQSEVEAADQVCNGHVHFHVREIDA